MKVPFLDLKVQYDSIREEIAAGLQGVLDNTAFAGGPFVAKFEEEFASFCQTGHAVGVGSGTDALWIALLALDIGPGDEVITVPNTFIATAEAISFCGATPVFVDIDERTYTMDPEKVEAAITPRTKAIVPVHLYGLMADMDPISVIANKHDIPVVEDAAQAHGATYKGRGVGSVGMLGCFSFYPGKNLGAYGEAGAVVTSDESLANRMKMFRDHGQEKKYYHSIVGWNARMDGFQGAVLSVKLERLSQWNDARAQHAQLYNELLADATDVITPYKPDHSKHVYHIYAIRVPDRQALLEQLREKEIYCGIHYPIPLHLQDAYKDLGYSEGDFPIAEKCAATRLSLPMYPELTYGQIEFVAREIQSGS